MVVAIHQPNFFPWLGYFNKIARADVFCLLDSVQFPKTGGTWTNRVKLAVNQTATWATVPVDRDFTGTRSVREITIAADPSWRRKLVQMIRSAYGRAACFGDVFPFLQELLECRCDSLAQFNETTIRGLCGALQLDDTRIVRSSSLEVTGQGTELLIGITRALDADTYLCGHGADGYQQDDLFEHAGIELRYQRFAHPTYPQAGNVFLPGLSVIDALMHCGFTETTRLITNA